MRYFVISDSSEEVAVVFHDYINNYVLCRSKTDSFRKVFDVVARKTDSKFFKNDYMLVLEVFDVSNYDWIDGVLNKVCSSGHWNITDRGELIGSEENIDKKIAEILT